MLSESTSLRYLGSQAQVTDVVMVFHCIEQCKTRNILPGCMVQLLSIHIQMPNSKGETKAMLEALKVVDNERAEEARPSRALCNQLEFLLNRVNVMHIYVANARLCNIAPLCLCDHLALCRLQTRKV